jgi:hypothetical protein
MQGATFSDCMGGHADVERAAVLGCRVTINPEVLGNPVWRLSGRDTLDNTLLELGRDGGPSNVLPRRPCLRHARPSALTDLTPSKCLGAEANQTFLSSVSTWPSRGLLDFEEEEEEEPYWVVSCALSPERALLMEFDLDAHVAQLTHKLLSRHLSKLARPAPLPALDPKAGQHANLFDRRNCRRELAVLHCL